MSGLEMFSNCFFQFVFAGDVVVPRSQRTLSLLVSANSSGDSMEDERLQTQVGRPRRGHRRKKSDCDKETNYLRVGPCRLATLFYQKSV